MAKILSVFVLPIIVLNWLGGLIGGIWLAIAGQWTLVGLGIATICFGHYILSLLLMPSMMLAIPAVKAFEARERTLGIFLSLPGILWTYALIGVSTFVVFTYVLVHSYSSLFPTLLWAYATATASWTYMAAMEARSDPNSASGTTAFGAQVGCIVMMVVCFMAKGQPTFGGLVIGLAIPLLLALLFQLVSVVLLTYESHRLEIE